jgi:diamine N-acetyltransferase
VRLRPTQPEDLDFVLALEHDPENRPFIGSWTREQHLAAIASPEREHWIVEHEARCGYLIAYDLRSLGQGIYLKRIVLESKGAGLGRRALACFVEHAFRELDAAVVWLAVFADNARAQRMYRALGFEQGVLGEAERAALREIETFGSSTLLMFLYRS